MATNTETTVYIIEMRDKFTMGMNKATNSATRFNNAVDKSKKQSEGLSKAFKTIAWTAIGYGAGRAIRHMTNLAGKFEEVRTAFNVMLGDKGLGGDLMGWAKEFSRMTVITFDQTVTSIRKLLAYGIGENNLRPLTKTLSTIAAGVGTDRLPYLTLALGQVFSRGRLMGTELRQFREHGVDIVSEVAKGLGIGNAQVEDMVTKGQVSFDMVAKSMINMTKEGGRFAGMLEEVAKTWPGMRAIFKSTMDIAVANLGEQLLPLLKSLTSSIMPALEKLSRLDWTGLTGLITDFTNSISRLFQVFTGENFLRTLYNASIQLTYVTAEISDKITTVVEIVKHEIIGLLDLFPAFWRALKAEWSLDFKARDKAYSDISNIANSDEWIKKQWNDLKWRNIRRETDYLRQLRAKTSDPLSADTGEYISVGDTGAEPMGAAKKSRTSKVHGTGARDIIINIGNLVENMTNYGNSTDENTEVFKSKMIKALTTVVNDVALTVK